LRLASHENKYAYGGEELDSLMQRVLAALFSWLRSLASIVWSMINSEQTGSGVTWLSENWWILIACIAAAGIIIDYLVWLIRWRPYYVWRSTIRRYAHRLKNGKETDTPEQAREASAYMTPTVPSYSEYSVPATDSYEQEDDDLSFFSFKNQGHQKLTAPPDIRKPRNYSAGLAKAAQSLKKSLVGEEEEDIGVYIPHQPDVDKYQAYYPPKHPTKKREDSL